MANMSPSSNVEDVLAFRTTHRQSLGLTEAEYTKYLHENKDIGAHPFEQNGSNPFDYTQPE